MGQENGQDDGNNSERRITCMKYIKTEDDRDDGNNFGGSIPEDASAEDREEDPEESLENAHEEVHEEDPDEVATETLKQSITETAEEASLEAPTEAESSGKKETKAIMKAKSKIVKPILKKLVTKKVVRSKDTPKTQVANSEEADNVLEAESEDNVVEASLEPLKKANEEASMEIYTDASEKVDAETNKEARSESPTKAESSGKKIPKTLKAKSKIVKPPLKRLVKLNAKATPKVQGINLEKKGSTLEGNVEEENAMALIPAEVNPQKNTSSTELIVNAENIQPNGDERGLVDDSKQRVRRRKRRGKKNKMIAEQRVDSAKRQQIKEHIDSEKRQPNNERVDIGKRLPYKDLGGSQRNTKNNDNQVVPKNSQNVDQKKKVAGLIFMCNGRTKPDCFRYSVMGVPTNQKDTILGVEPGVKLYLYDYELRLLYGVFQASSSGGTKLEPKAFGGSFPFQVRFKILTECNPLPEHVFKKAIEENYNEKKKFKTELTPKQVRKLNVLFRPSAGSSNARPTIRPPVSGKRGRDRESGRDRERGRDREKRGRVKGRSGRRDNYAYRGEENRALPTQERNQQDLSRQVEPPRDLYMSEREYRTYGLQGGEGRTQPHVAPSSDSYRRDFDREHLVRYPETVYRDTIMPAHREVVQPEPLYLTEREYRAYDLGARRQRLPPPVPLSAHPSHAASAMGSYARDTYYNYTSGAALADSYLAPLRREVNLVEAEPLRRESERLERLYPPYPHADSVSDYSQRRRYQGTDPVPPLAPVSSRYAFIGGASSSFR